MRACKDLRKQSFTLYGEELPIGVIRQKVAKPAVLGNQLGLGAAKLHYQNREYIRTEMEAQRYQDILAGEFPKPHRFKDQIRERAHVQTYLMNEFGRIQHFYEVFRFRWNDRAGCWDKRPGNDSEKVIAFPVQSNAHDMIQGKLFDIGLERCTEWGFMNCVHDSLEFMPRDEDVEECIETTANIMIQPCPQLVAPACPMGLSVGVDVSVGKNWMSWDEEKNPEGMKEIRSYPAIWEMPKAGRGDL
jgi:DNA polymerase I-like protein with 3'-5' exonuclease and polymerase domains